MKVVQSERAWDVPSFKSGRVSSSIHAKTPQIVTVLFANNVQTTLLKPKHRSSVSKISRDNNGATTVGRSRWNIKMH